MKPGSSLKSVEVADAAGRGRRAPGFWIGAMSRTVWLVSAALLGGCGSMRQTLPFDARLYEGQPRSPSEVAILRYGHGALAGKNLQIVYLTGPGVVWNGSRAVLQPPAAPTTRETIVQYGNVRNIELLPGSYSLTFYYFEQAGYGTFTSTSPMTLSFNAEAGHRYDLQGRRGQKGSWSATLTDETTGIRVDAQPVAMR